MTDPTRNLGMLVFLLLSRASGLVHHGGVPTAMITAWYIAREILKEQTA